MTTIFTESGVRLRLWQNRPGELNWLMLPGGPGIGSESLESLADAIDVPGSIWMVDLPGDGSNTDALGASPEPYSDWPDVLLEAAATVSNPVYVGHSTGGMYLLSVPKLEESVVGLVLISSSPDADWRPHFFEMTRQSPLTEVEVTTREYEADPTPERLRDLAVASAPWNFTAPGLADGRELLASMPYNPEAVAWSDGNFDETYSYKWWPAKIPTLILSGREDRIVLQSLWNKPVFQGSNVSHCWVENAAHFPWIDNPEDVRLAFDSFANVVLQQNLSDE